MEGVVVSAKKAGSTVTVSVVTDETGRYQFPSDRLLPGRYALTIRAAGYELPAPSVSVISPGRSTQSDLALVKTGDLALQLNNAEWLSSAPGTLEQKRMLLSCNECHTLSRPIMSTHTADEFVQVMERMSGYTYNASPDVPQRLSSTGKRDPERFRAAANYLSSINLGDRSVVPYPMKTLPRVSGKGTRVIITEYDLPRPDAQPHDVVIDHEGFAWYADFGQPFIGRLDPKTGSVKEFPVPVVVKGAPFGSLDLKVDASDDLWLGMLYQASIGRFNRRTGKWQIFPLPKTLRTTDIRLGHIGPLHESVDGKIWTANAHSVLRLDTKTGTYETVNPFSGSPPEWHAFNLYDGSPPAKNKSETTAQRVTADWSRFYNEDHEDAPFVAGRSGPAGGFSGVPAMYSLETDSNNNVYGLDFAGERIVRIDAKTKRITSFPTATYASRPRRGHMDAQDRLWFAEYGANRIGMLNTRTGEMKEWVMPTPWTSPYDVIADRHGYVWTAGMNSDRVVRLDSRSGEMIEFPLPRITNVRRVFVDDREPRTVFWIGNNQQSSIIKIEPIG